MSSRTRIQLIILALSALIYFPFAGWISTARYGTVLFLWGELFLYMIPFTVALCCVPVLIVQLFFKRKRRQAAWNLMLSVLFIVCCPIGIIFSETARLAGLRAFVNRSQEVISAIEAFEQDHAAPPRSLEELVPAYLPSKPSTGMMAYPEYRYVTGEEAKEEYFGNRFALVVFTPSGGINFDRMLYFPDQNYPDHGYGGSLGRIGAWAYVHE